MKKFLGSFIAIILAVITLHASRPVAVPVDPSVKVQQYYYFKVATGCGIDYAVTPVGPVNMQTSVLGCNNQTITCCSKAFKAEDVWTNPSTGRLEPKPGAGVDHEIKKSL